MENFDVLNKENIINMIKARNENLTTKWSCWDYLQRYLDRC